MLENQLSLGYYYRFRMMIAVTPSPILHPETKETHIEVITDMYVATQTKIGEPKIKFSECLCSIHSAPVGAATPSTGLRIYYRKAHLIVVDLLTSLRRSLYEPN